MSTSTKPQGRGLVMAAVFIATFMTSVEVTIVTTALPAIISDLHGLAYQSWIMSATYSQLPLQPQFMASWLIRLGAVAFFSGVWCCLRLARCSVA